MHHLPSPDHLNTFHPHLFPALVVPPINPPPKLRSLLRIIPHHKRTPLNRIHHNPPTLEQRIRAPASHKVQASLVWLIIVFGVDIKEAELLDALSGRVARDGRDINHTEAGAVVGLVGDAALDVLWGREGLAMMFERKGYLWEAEKEANLVVINSVLRGLVNSRLLRIPQIPDVPDVGGGVAIVQTIILSTIRNRPSSQSLQETHLIVLIIHNQILLIIGIQHPALMRISRTLITRPRNNFGILLIRNIINRERILVVSVANIDALVTPIRSFVFQTLRTVKFNQYLHATNLGKLQ